MQTALLAKPAARLFLSAAVIFATLAAVAGVSSALFSDTATLENSTFSTADGANLLIAADGPGDSPIEPYTDSIIGPTFTDMAPGDEVEHLFWLKNASDSDSLSLDLSVWVRNINSLPVDSALRDDLSVGFACDVDHDEEGDFVADGTVESKTLTAWAADTEPSGDLGTLAPDDGDSDGTGADEAKCMMTATLSESSTAENNSINFDAEFTGTQVIPE